MGVQGLFWKLQSSTGFVEQLVHWSNQKNELLLSYAQVLNSLIYDKDRKILNEEVSSFRLTFPSAHDTLLNCVKILTLKYFLWQKAVGECLTEFP